MTALLTEGPDIGLGTSLATLGAYVQRLGTK